jgi:chemotaxis response regulator CheB
MPERELQWFYTYLSAGLSTGGAYALREFLNNLSDADVPSEYIKVLVEHDKIHVYYRHIKEIF